MTSAAYPSVSNMSCGVTISPGANGNPCGRWVSIALWELGQNDSRCRVVPYGSEDHITALAAVYKARAVVAERVDLRLKVLNGPHAGEIWEVGAGMMNDIMLYGDQRR